MPVPVGWDVARAAQLYRDGWSLRQIGADVGVSAGSVRAQLVKGGVQMRPAHLPLGRPDVDTAEILRLRDQGMTWQAIADRVGMSTPGVVTRYRYARHPPRR